MQALPSSPQPTACVIIIGNEILSGRTQDKNLSWIAKELAECGVRLAEARVIPDIPDAIIRTVNEARSSFTYVFTTGGIGPTHDDITTECVARAFGVAVVRHPEAEALLARHYTPEQLNAARLKMADTPQGAELVPNPVSAAPGYRMDNVYVMAGVPSIMQAMFSFIKPTLSGGQRILSRTLSAYVTEGVIAEKLTLIQNRHPLVDIGSYPFIKQQRLGTSLVARGTDADALQRVCAELRAMLLEFSYEVTEEDLAAA